MALVGTLPNQFQDGINQIASGAQVMANLNAILAQVDGNLDAANIAARAIVEDKLSDALAAKLGITSNGVTRRGHVFVPTEESRTNTAYGTLATPDQVSSVVVGTGDIVEVEFRAMWKESVLQAARAAIFIGSNQLKTSSYDSASPVTTAAYTAVGSGANIYRVVASVPTGLASFTYPSAYTGDVTTGQTLAPWVLGGGTNPGGMEVAGAARDFGGDANEANMQFSSVCHIFNLPAGTYDFSVRWKAASGTVTAKNRNFWVRTQSFG